MRCALAILAVLTSTAVADPLAFELGIGARQQRLRGDLRATPQATAMTNPEDLGVALDVMVGYRFTPKLSIGGRFGMSKLDVERQWGRSSDGPLLDGYVRTPVDASLVVRVEHRRVWLAPWFGVQAMHEEDQARGMDEWDGDTYASNIRDEWTSSLSYGVSAGVDIVAHGADRMMLFAGAQSGTGGYSAVTFGLGYRR